VGTTSALREELSAHRVTVAYSPENLRLGKAIDAFTRAARTVVGIDPRDPRDVLESLLSPFAERLVWMTIPSAEMTKHAINAFLATSVAFTNELARLCEVTGADASEVEKGLRSEPRIGRGAYVRAGAAFAGGTLARDVIFLEDLGDRSSVSTPVMDGVLESNRAHQHWPDAAVARLAGALDGLEVAIWGLAYTVGTSTLRRSSSLELCERLTASGAHVRAFDPAVHALPVGRDEIRLARDALAATEGADALIVMTPWPEFASIQGEALIASMRRAVVIDPNADLAGTLDVPGIRYASVGRVPS
jgi:UDPglucose 6-dehydrogenase